MIWFLPLFFFGLAAYELITLAMALFVFVIIVLVCLSNQVARLFRKREKGCSCRGVGYPTPYHSRTCPLYRGYNKEDYAGCEEEQPISEL